jgi:hypothetical protein
MKKNLTDEQINAELERLYTKRVELNDKLTAEFDELDDERKQRMSRALAALSDDELIKNLRTLDSKDEKNCYDDERIRYILNEFDRREHERQSAKRKQRAERRQRRRA